MPRLPKKKVGVTKHNSLFVRVWDSESDKVFDRIMIKVAKKELVWSHHRFVNGEGCHFYRKLKKNVNSKNQ